MAVDRAGRILALALAGLIGLPVLPGLVRALAPAFTDDGFARLLASPDAWTGLALTIWTALASTALALLLALVIAASLQGRPGWHRLQARLPTWLALPHLAFAIGLALLVSPSGMLVRLWAAPFGWTVPPAFAVPGDPLGLSLIAGLTLKESIFLLWMIMAGWKQVDSGRAMAIAASLGYGRAQAFRMVILPGLLDKLGWPLAAVLAYGLSVVDMALVLGPGNPPTFAVSLWRWLSDADPAMAAAGSAGAIVLFVLLAAMIGLGRLAWARRPGRHAVPDGRRTGPDRLPGRPILLGIETLFVIVLALIAVWSFAGGWFFPDLVPGNLTLAHWQKAGFEPFAATLAIGLVTTFVALAVAVIWLEWGPKRADWLIGLPLVLPVLPIAIGQYATLLATGFDGRFAGVVWAHLFWVLPYVVLSLAGPYRAVDPRFDLIAASLGHGRLASLIRIRLPVLVRPLLLSAAVGFSVSVAQFLPTLFAGAGRIATVTTEAVALSSAGNRQIVAVQSLLQALLPLVGFGLTGLVCRLAVAQRRGLA